MFGLSNVFGVNLEIENDEHFSEFPLIVIQPRVSGDVLFGLDNMVVQIV